MIDLSQMRESTHALGDDWQRSSSGLYLPEGLALTQMRLAAEVRLRRELHDKANGYNSTQRLDWFLAEPEPTEESPETTDRNVGLDYLFDAILGDDERWNDLLPGATNEQINDVLQRVTGGNRSRSDGPYHWDLEIDKWTFKCHRGAERIYWANGTGLTQAVRDILSIPEVAA